MWVLVTRMVKSGLSNWMFGIWEGHLDTTFRGWSSTLAAWVRPVISRLALVFLLPLDFHGRVRVDRSMYLLAALHGIEASFLASDSLRKLRSSIRRDGVVSSPAISQCWSCP